MQFSKSLPFSIANLNKDLFRVLLILVIGIGGQIVVLNPVEILAPKHPMISTQDWLGSREVSKLKFSRSWQWEKRVLTIRLRTVEYTSGHTGVEIWQRSVWYANPEYAVQSFERRDSGQFASFAKQQPVMITPAQEGKPASVLYCHEYNTHGLKCTYFTYLGHWYTEVWFSGGGEDNYPLDSEMQKIIEIVDQLLISANE
ncbi:MAG: hypothetical protein JNJ43_04855 [Anaerolineales bacterium]|nr:hypothetical protein [Anaerolineales bacterium]